jgi:hypothetical protein
MPRKKRRKVSEKILRRLICICAILNAALYAGFVALDLLRAADVPIPDPSPSNAMKYATILSCLLITLFAAAWNKRNADLSSRLRMARIQAVVFGITLAADFFLLFTDHFVAGLLVFLLAHLTALFRYRPRWVPLFAAAAGALCLAAWIVGDSYHSELQLLRFALLCIAYAALIGGVLIAAIVAEQPRINALLSRIGMILFICCDVHVFFANFLTSENAYYEPALVLMWVFYLPAQTMLALSVVPFSPRSKNSI